MQNNSGQMKEAHNMDMQQVLDFLVQLEQNNNKDWFDSHREEYESGRQQFKNFVAALLKEMAAFEPFADMLAPKDCIFRINRDIRFSKDKTPYKNNMGAYFAEGGKKSPAAGYYLHIQPGNKSMLAGGMWMPEAEVLKNIRQEIDYNGAELQQVLNDTAFKKYYGKLDEEEKLKTAPKGYPSDHPDIALLRLKSFVGVHMLKDEQVASPDFINYVLNTWKALKPLNDFLNVAVS
jgi:uncharacterized protein (TIGR02453 family)